MKAPEPPKYKPAFFVASWGNEIVKGFAFNITYIDWYEKKMSFFIKEGETIPKIIEAKQIEYSEEEAHRLLNKEKSAKRKYYEDQIKEYTETLKNICS